MMNLWASTGWVLAALAAFTATAACTVESSAPAADGPADAAPPREDALPGRATDAASTRDGEPQDSSMAFDVASDDVMDSGPILDGPIDAPPDVWTTTLAPCNPACGASGVCVYPTTGGVDAGCDGSCPPPPPPQCEPIPTACSTQVSCDCLASTWCAGCGAAWENTSCGYAGGQWVFECHGC